MPRSFTARPWRFRSFGTANTGPMPISAERADDVADHAGAGHAIRVADADRAAVRVVRRVVEAELVAAVEALRRERLVQLHDAEILHREAVALQELRHREHGADAHLV